MSKRTLLLTLAASLLILHLLYPVRAESDLWGHVLYGGATLELGGLPTANTYSFTAPDHPWTNHEWLFEVLMAWTHRHGGATGLVLLFAFWVVATALGLATLVREAARRHGRFETTSLLAAILVLAPLMRIGMWIRPHLATYAFTVLFLVVLQRADGARRLPRAAYLLPLVMIVWTNLHGGFLVGLVLLVAFVAYQTLPGSLVGRPGSRHDLRIPALVVTGLSALGTLLNPYGFRHWTWLWEALSRPRPEIREWRSALFWWKQPVVLAYILAVLALAALLVLRRRRYGGFLAFAWLGMAFMGLLHIRHIPLAVLAGVPVFLPPFDDLLRGGPDSAAGGSMTISRRAVRRALGSVLALIAASFLLSVILSWRRDGLAHIEVRADRFPVDAVRFLQGQQARGNLVCSYDWGQYCIWHLYPACRVAVDGRFRTAYPADVLAAYFRFSEARPGWAELLDRYQATLILMPRNRRLESLLEGRADWSPVYRDRVATVWALRAGINQSLLAAGSGRPATPAVPVRRAFWP